MKRWLVVLACVAVATGMVFAGDPDPAGGDGQMKELKAKMGDVNKQLEVVKKRLNEDAEVAPLLKAVNEAKQAYDAKLKEKVAADADGAALMAQMDALKKEMGALMPKPEKREKKEKAAQ